MWDFRTIVAAIDFSEHSAEVLRVASCLAAARFSELHVVHVLSETTPQVDLAGLAADAEARLARLSGERVKVTRLVRRVLVGSPAEAIARYAADHHAHLIVMGTHGYGPVRRLLVGSVARRVLRRAPCAVLTVPPRQTAGQNGEAAPTASATAG